MLFDTHAHLHDPAYDPDREVVLERAREAGLTRILTVGCDLADSGRALACAQAHSRPDLPIDASIGIHPHEAQTAPADIPAAFDALIASAAQPPTAIGEIGLDHHYDHSPREIQRTVLAEQLRYARSRALPVIFHEREAHEAFIAVLREEWAAPMRGVIHCFTGDTARARTYTEEFGLLLGIGGVITFKNAQDLRDAVRAVGVEHLILETDCPYLAPIPHRGTRNEPAHVAIVAKTAAELLGMEATEFIARTTDNAIRLFGKTPVFAEKRR